MNDPDQLAFGPDEMLYRTFSRDQQLRATGKLKPNALRPQFSVRRSSLVGVDEIPAGDKFNGVAAITVAQVRAIEGGFLTAHCVFEPAREDPAHSLIALVTHVEPGTPLLVDFEKTRAAIAAAMDIKREAR